MMAFTAAMEPERRAVMLKFIAERETLAPAVGTEAPDFKLPRLGGGGLVRTLVVARPQKPVALIFGSYT